MAQVHPDMAEQLTPIVVDAVMAIREEDKPIDLHMIEMMEMQHRLDYLDFVLLFVRSIMIIIPLAYYHIKNRIRQILKGIFYIFHFMSVKAVYYFIMGFCLMSNVRFLFLRF